MTEPAISIAGPAPLDDTGCGWCSNLDAAPCATCGEDVCSACLVGCEECGQKTCPRCRWATPVAPEWLVYQLCIHCCERHEQHPHLTLREWPDTADRGE